MELKKIPTIEVKNNSWDETIHNLNTNDNGLSTVEVENRVKIYGFNEIKETEKHPIFDFLKRYWGPMPWLLEFAIVLTIIMNHYTESVIIFVLLTANSIIGFMQSQNSQKAVGLLKRKLEINVKVMRDGEWSIKEAKDLVIGDIINLRLGDLIPADVQIISGKVSVDESALTGESLPKELQDNDIMYSSSTVKRGEAKCVVVNTGVDTYFGKTVELVRFARPKSKQEKLMLDIVKNMLYLGIIASVIVSIYAIYLHKDLLFILSFIVIFLIGAIPVALPAVLTIVQAMGALELSKKGVLVTRLDSIEDAASLDIFCFDKTGTITQNKLAVMESESYQSYTKDQTIRFASLASQEEGMDAIDLSILEYAATNQINDQDYLKKKFIPFSPENKRSAAFVEFNGSTQQIIKGAAQTIFALCSETNAEILKSAEDTVNQFSRKGFRSIAVAISNPDQVEKFNLVGLLGISDPPRDDSKAMLAEIKRLGIKSLMLTGDSIAIAQEVAGQVGIEGDIYRVSDLEGLDFQSQVDFIEASGGFAEVFPEDKYRIVKLLQDHGHVVGMTGDGVNDSPALKQADLGTAVSAATDVAKASGSMVLTKPGLSEIIDALKVSRKTYQRMLTWVINKITKVVEVVVLFTIGFFLFHDVLVSLLGMSLLVFANDFITMSIATDNVVSTDSPNHWNIRTITLSSFVLGVFFAIEDLLLVFIGLHYMKLSFEKLQTLVLLSLVFNTQLRILIVRERNHFWSSYPNSKLVLLNILTVIGFSLLSISGLLMPSLLISQIAITLGVALVFMVLIDFVKFGLFKWLGL